MDISRPNPRPAKETSPASSNPLHVLLVEDHADTLAMLQRVLCRLGYSVTTAPTLHAARAAADSNPFDLLICDIGLPDGTGLDLVRDLRSRGNAAPAIALTGYGMEDDIRAAASAGFNSHLTKPVDVLRLEQTIRQVAGNHHSAA